MKINYYLSWIFLSLIVLQSCKKEEPIICESEYNPNVAPCSINETIFPIDSIFNNPSSNFFPDAIYSVKFTDTVNVPSQIHQVEFFFNKIPVSGKYHLVYQFENTSQIKPNQIGYVGEFNNFQNRSGVSDDAEIYVENNDSEIIISWCGISNNYVSFDPSCNCYVGNGIDSLYVRKAY